MVNIKKHIDKSLQLHERRTKNNKRVVLKILSQTTLRQMDKNVLINILHTNFDINIDQLKKMNKYPLIQLYRNLFFKRRINKKNIFL